ncbi:amidohydrolase family protein [Paracoccus laeviglucosivorans]|uniref:Amidohydrolase n=1 Tax=Paracoccus laeviglucosivorans TaxID=1197861 RepID=A0A521FAK1_9RHOB|nr:amidohydrolase family protein [Paracoccus laeviglucosivorans]SMO93186.1 Amidohydrolase [Paracoccus laeviglucosivorans]
MTAICDTHVHIFDPKNFPYAAGRAYTPPRALLPELRANMALLNAGRCVLVQPSVYGTDNACLLDGLRSLGAAARGVAVIDPLATTDKELADLHAAGVRAVRVNFEDRQGGAPVDKIEVIRATANRVASGGMAVQLYVDLHTAAQVVDLSCFGDGCRSLTILRGSRSATGLPTRHLSG